MSIATWKWLRLDENNTTLSDLIRVINMRLASLGQAVSRDVPAGRPVVTGSRGGNAALASLLTQLDADGYITNNTTA